MRFHVLGPLEVIRDGQPIVVPGVHQRATLGFLLLHPNTAVATSRLLQALWDQEPPVTARKMVQNAVAGLRRTLGGGADVLTRPPGYQLSIRADQVDLAAFQELSARGRAELAAGSWAAAAATLSAALGHWRGPALADLAEEGLAWPEAVALDSARMVTFEDWAEAQLALGHHQELVPELESAVETTPLRERLTGLLMLALYRCGRQADALERYRRTRGALVDQLGLDPGHELQNLERAILDHEPWLSSRPTGALTSRHAGVLAPGRMIAGSGALAGTGALARAGAVAGTGGLAAGGVVAAAGVAGMGGDGGAAGARLPEVFPARAPGVHAARKWVSVLAGRLDIGSGAELSDPEDADRVLRAVTATVRAETARFGGEVHTALGSVWIAVFGLPRTREDDAERAVRAGLAIRRAVATSAKASSYGVGQYDLRMAVTTGEVLATLTQATPAAAASAAAAAMSGDVTGRCMRLLASVPRGELRVCEATRAASDGAFTHASTDEHGRGVGGVVAVRLGGLASAFGAGPAGREGALHVPFLEREHEKDLMHRLLAETARRRRPRLVTIFGEPGIGKSRLLWEFCREAGDAAVSRDVQFLHGRIGRFQSGPFEVLTDITRTWAGIAEDDSRELAVTKLAAAVGMTGATFEVSRRLAAELVPLLDPAWPGGEDGARVLAAWRRTLGRIAAVAPTVLVVEDLHRGDDRLLDCLEVLDEQLGRVPLLVVASTRPDLLERRPCWAGGKRDATTMSLDQLSAAAIQHLMVDLAVLYGLRPASSAPPLAGAGGGGPAPETAAHECGTVAKVGGNPLFAVALVEMLRAARAAKGDGVSPALLIDSAGPIGPGSAMVSIPRTVHGVIAAWLDTLPSRSRLVLQGAAVFGATVWAAPVAAECELTREDVLRELEYLERRGVLRQMPTVADPDPHYEFRHAFVRDVAYSQIPRAVRGGWHLCFARWLGDEYGRVAQDDLRRHHHRRADSLTAAAG
ncbi:transcriptional regulator, SARP family [Parafrankia sp. EAN1pec]|uniref:BTAD domain-containing putative transcriptional regulator n=1 Tax=Parafrankia sp. (strain EAN1pec) TaxID=298653 RepID=UPI0000541EA3|nr:transcriptional regulator, SARP family [Frankia sp. EAN1pec]